MEKFSQLAISINKIHVKHVLDSIGRGHPKLKYYRAVKNTSRAWIRFKIYGSL